MSLQDTTTDIHHGKNVTGFQKEMCCTELCTGVVQNYAVECTLYLQDCYGLHTYLLDEYFADTSAHFTVGKLFVEFTYQSK